MYHIDCLGLVETNINWKNAMVKHKIQNTFRKYWQKTLIATSSTSILHTGIYQPGGTLSLVGDKWTGGGRIYEDTSGLGRWTELRLHGRQKRQLSIITVYRVPYTTIAHAGTNTSYYHQWHHLRRQKHKAPDPRAQVLQDLGEYIELLQADYHAILIMIDANESYDERNSSLQKWITLHDLKDVHQYLHQYNTTISTYARGTKRIDYIFATDNILPYVLKGGILPFHFLKTTDHRALYVEIDLQKFLRCQVATSTTQRNRLLTSRNPRGIKRYCHQLTQWLNESSIEQELHNISQYQDDQLDDAKIHRLEELDTLS